MARDPVWSDVGPAAPAADGGAAVVGEAAGWSVYGDAFDPGFGNSAAFELDESGNTVLAEGRDGHVTPAPPTGAVPLCFIDGRRRVELGLWAEQAGTGRRVAGLAGAYAVGAVTIPPGRPARFAGVRVGRVAIWGGGRSGDIAARHGYHWASASTAAEDPAVILANLQERMRRAEGNLALDAAGCGWNVVLDGPLNRIRSLHQLVTGYVKSHSSRLLPEEAHAAVPGLAVGARTPVYAVGDDRYTCYVRVGEARRAESPWTGIARLQFPAVAGLASVVARADLLAAMLPRYAGARHRDPRAPVNLTPVKNLEEHLSRMLGPIELATRAAREALAPRTMP
jgi:hypothetical protein